MKNMMITFLAICGLIPISNSCTNKEINLLYNNPVEVAADFVSNAFINEPLEAILKFIPENGEYPVNYSLRHEVENGEGVYQIDDEVFTTEDIQTFENAPEILVTIRYEGNIEGKHKSKWILRNDFDQEFVTYIEFDLKKNPVPDPDPSPFPDPDPTKNNNPVAVADTITVKSEIRKEILALQNDGDPESDPIEIVAIEKALNGEAVLEGGKVFYTSNDNFTGEDKFTYTIQDDKGLQDQGTISLTIVDNNIDLAPNTVDDEVTTPFETFILIDVVSNDEDDITAIKDLKLISVTEPENGTAVIEDGKIRYTPNDDYSGTETFTYTIEDESKNTSIGTVKVFVEEMIDLAPNTVDDEVTTPFETFILIDVVSNDDDDITTTKDLKLISVTEPENGTADIEDGKIRYVPNDDYSGEDTFTYTIEDEGKNTSVGTIKVLVEAIINQAPEAKDDKIDVEIFDKTPIDVLLNDSDPEGDKLKIVLFNIDRLNGTVEIIDDKIVYKANLQNFVGFDNFTYFVEDTAGNQSEPATVSVNVTGKFFPISESVEQRLVNRGFDSDGTVNGLILAEDANKITNLLFKGAQYTDLSDLRFFPNLRSLSVSDTNLTEIDLSKNTNLLELFLDSNDLRTVDISNNQSLSSLIIRFNPNLTSIVSDNVNPALKKIITFGSSMIDFDGSNFPSLQELFMEKGILENVDVSKNSNLREIVLNDNNLKNIKLSNGNSALTTLTLNNNKLENIDLSGLTKLISLNVAENLLTSLNVNGITKINSIAAGRNYISKIQLTELDFINLRRFSTGGMFVPLTCVAVDDPVFARQHTIEYSGGFTIDAAANPGIYSLECE